MSGWRAMRCIIDCDTLNAGRIVWLAIIIGWEPPQTGESRRYLKRPSIRVHDFMLASSSPVKLIFFLLGSCRWPSPLAVLLRGPFRRTDDLIGFQAPSASRGPSNFPERRGTSQRLVPDPEKGGWTGQVSVPRGRHIVAILSGRVRKGRDSRRNKRTVWQLNSE